MVEIDKITLKQILQACLLSYDNIPLESIILKYHIAPACAIDGITLCNFFKKQDRSENRILEPIVANCSQCQKEVNLADYSTFYPDLNDKALCPSCFQKETQEENEGEEEEE